MKTIYYWSPFITPVATTKAVINSAYAVKLYSKKKYEPFIINVAGEWDIYKRDLENKKIKLIELTSSKIINNKKTTGFMKSRLLYIYIFFIALVPLIRLLRNNPPSFFIIHLISPLPLLINYLLKINTKMILRISGLPKLNYLRKCLWQTTLKKIYHLTCPTKATKHDMQVQGIIEKNKIDVLYDPIISPKNIINNLKVSNNNLKDRNYFLSIGRLSRQKNYKFLIETFKIFNQNKNNKLIIVGEGEQRNALLKFIKLNKLKNSVEIHKHTKEIFDYYKYSKCFILSSLWEDPGFVLVEACYMKTLIISSDCKNGPKEILDNEKNGLLFKSNDKEDLLKTFEKFENLKIDHIKKLKINALKKSKEFTIINHHKTLLKILEKNG
jgi:glycosyltransferase involved in cell wall biosynthesis